MRMRWRKCVELLSLDDEDYVEQLKIFSLNSATVKLKYQVNSVDQRCPGGPEEIEVFCTWNQFFLSGLGLTKSEAEQAAARTRLNCCLQSSRNSRNLLLSHGIIRA